MECDNCKGRRLVPYAMLLDAGDASDLEIAVQEEPDASVFKGWHLIKVTGTVCCDCGKVFFTAVGDLEELWAAFQRSGKEVALPQARIETKGKSSGKA